MNICYKLCSILLFSGGFVYDDDGVNKAYCSLTGTNVKLFIPIVLIVLSNL